jgi:hypothetical protein
MILENPWAVEFNCDSGTLVQSFATATDDDGSSTFTAYSREEESNGASWVEAVATPASGTRRIDWIEIVNTDTVTRTVGVRLNNATVQRATKTWTLPAGRSVQWTPALGWHTESTATAVGDSAWETQMLSTIGADKCNPAVAMLHMQRAGNVAATPTNVSTSVARCSLFRPPQDITINTIRYYGVGATTNVYRVAIYRLSDLARLTAESAFTTTANTWGTAATSLSLSLTAGTAYFIACSVNATGTTAGVGCVGGTVAATTGQIQSTPAALPGNLGPSLGYLDGYFFQFAVTTGALPDPAATLAAQAAWTGGMPCFFLEP